MEEELSEVTHTESDSIGEREVPETTLYGVQTLRGVEDLRISEYYPCEYPLFISALAITEVGAAMASFELGSLTEEQTNVILHAYKEILEGKHHDQFPVDIIQGGVGTTTNMNADEVVVSRALELMGHKRGEYQYYSPNDRVNCPQPINDIYPTAIHISMHYIHLKLVGHFKKAIGAFWRKTEESVHVIKMGRMQSEDVVSTILEQTFNGSVNVLQDEIKNLDSAAQGFLTINMGVTAIRIGIITEPECTTKCIAALREITGLDIRLADDPIGTTSDTPCLAGYSSAVRRTAVKMNKICSDLCPPASGSRCGLGETNLPVMQPGSSTMPGKVNPVTPKVMNRIDYKVIDNDPYVAMSGKAVQMGLNVMESVMAQCHFESADLLMNGFDTLCILRIGGITANGEKCRKDAHNNIGVATALSPVIRYKNSTEIAKEAQETDKGIYELMLEHNTLSKEDLDTILKPENMIHPVKLDIKPNNRSGGSDQHI